MKWRILSILLMSLLLGSGALQAQRRKKPPKDNKEVTPENAAKQDHKNKQEKVGQYEQRKNYHQKNQDKATRKRMKKNLRRAEKHSWGKDVPWYKRWFRKKRFS